MLLLDELLMAENFGNAVDALAADFRKEHNLPKVHQLGLVVPDVEAAAERLENMGIGPFLISSGSLARWGFGSNLLALPIIFWVDWKKSQVSDVLMWDKSR